MPSSSISRSRRHLPVLSRGCTTVIGQLSGGEGLAVVLPHGSGNTDIVDSTVRALLANNTIGELAHRWLGGTGGNIPFIRTDG